jgi:transposase InsO family protein
LAVHSKLITDNAAAFKSKKMVDFCYKYNISLGHSTAYHPQGNGLAESSKITSEHYQEMLEINKKSWHKKLVNALWAESWKIRPSMARNFQNCGIPWK